jgi:hypothetical protein
MRKLALIVIYVLGFAALPPSLGGQTAPSQWPTATPPSLAVERDIAARKKALLDESSDLEEMGKSLQGTELETTAALDAKAGQGVMELDATLWLLGVYDNMQCESDREVVKNALKNRLAFYSHLLGLEADQVVAHLGFTKLPATAQAGERIKNDLRAAKAKLDEILVSLN